MVDKSNIGITGPESIRVGGKEAHELDPRGQQEVALKIRMTDRMMKIKEIKGRCPPYNVPALRAGIKQSKDNIRRFEEAIEKERESITEFTVALAKCEQRDKELKELGAD